MLRVRLKADGRLVEILPDGSEGPILISERRARAARQRCETFAERPLRRGRLRAQCARADRADPDCLRRADRGAGRDRAQLGTGQTVAAWTGPGVAQGH